MSDDKTYTIEEIRDALDELEREGLIIKTGEMRPNQKGELRPVYVDVAQATREQLEAARRRKQ